MNNNLDWRRNKVLELASQGYNQSEIARILQISQPTINRDIAFLRKEAKENIHRYIDEELPAEYEKTRVGITSILRDALGIAKNAVNEKDKIQALSLAKECYAMKRDLLTNATVVDDAIRFVSSKHKQMEEKPVKKDHSLLEQDNGQGIDTIGTKRHDERRPMGTTITNRTF